MTTPPDSLFLERYDYAKGFGLSDRAAELYATLMYWGAFYDLEPARIVSGYRSPARQQQLLREWQQQGRNGPNRLVTKPAVNSAHSSREAFDLERVPHLWAYGFFAPYASGRWGGNFTNPDPVHFDTRAT